MTVVMIAKLTALGCIALLIWATAQPAFADRALIIGINQYPGLAAGSQLSGAVNDAALMARIARETWGFKDDEIKVLHDSEATAGAIHAALKSWIVAGTRPGDRALIYFSGHGYYVEDKNGDEADGRDEVLVASDARFVNGRFENLIIDDDLDSFLKTIGDRSVMLIADSCHSGTIERALRPRSEGEIVVRFPAWGPATRGADGKDLNIALKTTEADFGRLRRDDTLISGGRNLLVWTAAAATQVAQEDVSRSPPVRNGVFTRAFAEGLAGAGDANGDGKVTAGELLAYTRTESSKYCRSYACKTGMDPTFAPGGADLARDMSRWPQAQESASTPSPAEIVAAIPSSAATFKVDVEIEPGAKLRVGDKIKLRIDSSRPGHVVVLDMRDDGKVYQLFPSVCTHADRTIAAGRPLLMPDPLYGCEFTANETGGGKIVVVVAEDKPLDALLEETKSKGIEAVGAPSQYLGTIAEQLLSIWTSDAQNRPARWGIATASYTIGR